MAETEEPELVIPRAGRFSHDPTQYRAPKLGDECLCRRWQVHGVVLQGQRRHGVVVDERLPRRGHLPQLDSTYPLQRERAHQ